MKRRVPAPSGGVAAGQRLEVSIAWSCRARKPRGYSVARVRRAVAAALEVGGGEWPRSELSLVFVDDADLAQMHADWLDDSTLTDVITFDLRDDPSGPAGELYVSVERALDVAARRGLDPARELLLYVVHGVLHLCGFDDHEPADRRRMRAAERRAFTLLDAK